MKHFNFGNLEMRWAGKFGAFFCCLIVPTGEKKEETKKNNKEKEKSLGSLKEKRK